MWGNDLLLPFQIFRTWFSHHFYPSFSMSPCLNLSVPPFRRSYLLLLIVFLPALFLLWHSGNWAIIVKPRRRNSSCPRLQSCRIRQGCTEMTRNGHYKLKRIFFFFFKSHPLWIQRLSWYWWHTAWVTLALWTPFEMPHLARDSALPISIACSIRTCSLCPILMGLQSSNVSVRRQFQSKLVPEVTLLLRLFFFFFLIEIPFNFFFFFS